MAKGENIFKRKDGRWEARYIKGYELSGKIKYGFCYTNLTNREISVTGNLPLLVGENLPKPLIDRTGPVRLRPAKQCYFSC